MFDFVVDLRMTPATFGTLRSYSGDGKEISRIVEGSVRFGNGKELRFTVSGSASDTE
jgi:hypothetical protein